LPVRVRSSEGLGRVLAQPSRCALARRRKIGGLAGSLAEVACRARKE
jgi:hypothetical protein